MEKNKISYYKNLSRAIGLTPIKTELPNDERYVFGSDDIYKLETYGWSVSLNFSSQQIIYPEKIIGRERNSDFRQPENFVVFECVCRLLNKGYKQTDIELEKEWHLGHDAKGGRCDIIVYDHLNDSTTTNNDRDVLCIIECKTYGDEFEKELRNLKTDGGQLFSYFQQERSCKWLILYASKYDYETNSIIYQIATIKAIDDQNIVLLSENQKNSDINLFKHSYTTNQLFNVWKETYDSQILGDVIFREDTKPYEIGIKPLLKKDLIDFTDSGKIINGFEEILRHNNVSDKENAFNRLIALFICKLVDEITKTDDDIVEFQYKVGSDTYETLQDRLQRLHKEGMDQFMREKILYISDDYPVQLLKQYTSKENRNELIKNLQNTIKILKFYTNNDFAFKDVHNEELFYQNGKLLVEVIELFQNYRIIGSSNLQLLGDLFEKLLDNGFKQNEGQFFTPTPITRFIWKSLPLERILLKNGKFVYPKIIDYACGAGHFLTEGIEEIKYFLNKYNISVSDNLYKDKIFGIEKDYRLSRVSKVSMFMHGAGDSNIIFGDGLDNYIDKGVENGSFDILVANPPYSVKGFKPHLNLKNNKLSILDYVSNDGSEIEVCFIERISQLLKPNGIAAVILPSSILTNENNSYSKARESILKNFLIKGIASFGNQTFGATSTNTVILFLEKYNEPPKVANLYLDSINAIFNTENLNNWEDSDILEQYLEQIKVDNDFYQGFLSAKLMLSDFKDNEHFSIYLQAFEKSLEVKNLIKSKLYKNASPEEQNKLYLDKFYNYIKPIEKEKILYFSLVYKQKTVIVKSPSENKQEKEFLGYSWSSRKTSKGIQILKMGGKLFGYDNSIYVSDLIRDSFNSQFNNTSEYCEHVSTKDMLNFSKDSFNKEIKLFFNKNSINISSNYNLVKLFEISKLFRGVTYSQPDQELHETSNIILTADNITLDGRFEINKKIYISDSLKLSKDCQLKAKDIFICMASGSKKHIGKVAYIYSDTNFYAGGFMGIIRTKPELCIAKYLYYILNSPQIKQLIASNSSGSNINNLSNQIGNIKVPLPPIEIQRQIVQECDEVEKEYNTTRMSIEAYRSKIQDLFSELDILSSNRGGELSVK